MKQRLKIFDTTLRDGEQAPGCSMGLAEKVEIALALERMGVDIIEAGFPIASPGDMEAVQAVSKAVKNATVAGLARAIKKDIDAAWRGIAHAVSPRIHTFVATSPVHMTYKLKMTPEQVLDTIYEMVRYAKAYCPDVEFSAEDAMRSEPAFLAKAMQAAIAAGATVINVPDTVGYATPQEMMQMLSYLKQNVPDIHKAELSVHCHDDLGMGVANSLASVLAGATQVEGTMNGIGERAGNAALEEVIMGIHTRKDQYPVELCVNTQQIYATSRLVYNVIGMSAPMNKAIVGANAFAHEAGIHQHGMMENRETYEIMTPQSVGLVQNKMVLGKHSGRHAVESRLNELGFTLSPEDLTALFERFKVLADKKKTVNDWDLSALATHQTLPDQGAYALERFTVNSTNFATCNAVVSLRWGEEVFEEVCLGDGPVDAAYNAIDKIIRLSEEHALDDYAIRTVSEGKDAQGEAMVRIRCGERVEIGRGLSTDVIEASLLAYINAMNKLV